MKKLLESPSKFGKETVYTLNIEKTIVIKIYIHIQSEKIKNNG